jgi:glutamate-ammonia-ligase adenylyltransferase
VLTQGYVFFRRVEHLLQLDRFEQTHTLPGPDGMGRLARLMRHAGTGAFEEELQRHRNEIMRVCDGILLGGREEAASATAMRSLALFPDPDAASRLLHEIRDGREGRQHDHAAARLAEQAVPLIAVDAAEEALPLQALRSIEQLVNRSGHPAAVFGYLREQGPRRFLLRVGALAPVALRDITVDPLVLDAVFSGRAEEFSPLSDARRLKRAVEIDALGRLLLDSSGIDEYARELSAVADELVHAAWLLATGKADAPFLVLAMGKYGGEELTPGSDLDVVFLYQADRLGNEEAQSMAREFIRVLQASGGADMLYTVDARLRPEGRSAPLAVSLETYRQYFASRASLWERQSLLRARVVAGPPSMAAVVNSVIADALDVIPATAATWKEIESMRGRMEPVNRFGRDDFFDIKLSPGGLVDAEFAAQLLMLATGRELRTPNTFHALALAGGVTGRLERSFGEIDEDYRFLRTLQLRLRLLSDLPGNLLPVDDRELDTLALSMRCANADDFRAELRQRRERLRRNFTSVIEHLSSPQSRD